MTVERHYHCQRCGELLSDIGLDGPYLVKFECPVCGHIEYHKRL
mgnify:CR=1 FL=1